MKTHSISKLTLSLIKIYFSDLPHKKAEYKKTIFNSLRCMGGIYIKFLQILSVSYKFMDGWSTPKDYEVFNKVRPEYINLRRYLLHQENYDSFDEEPFACGSFAQIYRGKLKNGENVAIKVLRPSIYNNLKNDLKTLKRILKIVACFLPESIIDYKDAFNEFARNCLLEVNYENEIYNMEYFYKYYEDNSVIVIPKVYKNLSSSNIIVQELIKGPTLADLITNKNDNKSIADVNYELTGSDLWKQIILVGGEALKTAMTSEYVYGDPHPGNIILLPENKVALVDFGLIAKKPISQEAFYLWVKSYYEVLLGNPDYDTLLRTTCMCFCPDLTNALEKYFGTNNFINSVSKILNVEAQHLIQNNNDALKTVNNGHVLMLFLDFVESTKSINLKLDLRNYELLKAMQAFIGSVTTIDKKEKDDMYSYLMIESMKYALDYCNEIGVINDFSPSTKYNKNESYEIFMNFLTNIAESDEFLFNKITERMFL